LRFSFGPFAIWVFENRTYAAKPGGVEAIGRRLAWAGFFDEQAESRQLLQGLMDVCGHSFDAVFEEPPSRDAFECVGGARVLGEVFENLASEFGRCMRLGFGCLCIDDALSAGAVPRDCEVAVMRCGPLWRG
jgi:hypothetical protein